MAGPTLKHDIVKATMEASPSAFAIVATWLAAINMQWVMAAFGACFIALQFAYLCWKWRNEAADREAQQAQVREELERLRLDNARLRKEHDDGAGGTG